MIVRTILGDIAPGELGVTYAHEHLIIDSALVARVWPYIHLPSVDAAVAELALCRAVGVATVVDAMPTGSGRSVAKLVEISRQSGLGVIASTGMHTGKYYENVDWASDQPGALAERFTAEVLDGMDGTTARAGIIKVATGGDRLTDHEQRLFEAAALVHARTRVPILTHCEEGGGGMIQIETLLGLGVPLEKVVLSHTDKVSDTAYHHDLLATGVNLVYDQALRGYQDSSPPTAALVAAMWEAGFGSQLLLGTDGARRSLWTALGGEPGLAWLRTGFASGLRRLGLVTEQVEAMFVTNPARVLSFNPPP